MDSKCSPLDAAMRFLGHGEPENAVWFVGLEYADAYGSAAEAQENYALHGEVERPTGPPDFSELGRKGLAIRHLTARILKSVSRRGAPHEHEWFMNNCLWWPESATFQANLFPLGMSAHTTGIPEIYQREFGVGNWGEYRKQVRDYRIPLLKRLWASSSRKAVVCFGSGESELFKQAFDVASEPEDIVPGKVVAFRKERVLITPFFDFRLFLSEDADRVGAFLRDELKVEIP